MSLPTPATHASGLGVALVAALVVLVGLRALRMPPSSATLHQVLPPASRPIPLSHAAAVAPTPPPSTIPNLKRVSDGGPIARWETGRFVVDPGCPRRWTPKSPHPKCEPHAVRDVGTLECVRWGTVYGGGDFPTELCGIEGAVVYAFGVGEDVSWDLALASMTKTRHFMFDPTPRARTHIDAVVSVLRSRTAPQVGPQPDKYLVPDSSVIGRGPVIAEVSGQLSSAEYFTKYVLNSEVTADQIAFYPWGLWVEDTTLDFVLPVVGVSGSLVVGGGSDRVVVKAEVKTLESIMGALGHDRIDALKFDIEGAETRVIPQLVAFFERRFPRKRDWPQLISFDLDSERADHSASNPIEARKCLDLLEAAGYRIFSGVNHDYVLVMSQA